MKTAVNKWKVLSMCLQTWKRVQLSTVHELPVGITRPSKLFLLILAKPYTWRDTYFATVFLFVSLSGWYSSCWWLEGGSGSWQTCSKWNISASLLIAPHTSYQHPGSSTPFSCWECKRAPSDRKQKEVQLRGAGFHIRQQKRAELRLRWHAWCRRSATKRLLWTLTAHSLRRAQRSPHQTFLSHTWRKLCTRTWYQIGPAWNTM